MSRVDFLKDIFFNTLETVEPHKLIHKNISYKNNEISIQNKTFPLNRKITLLGSGKASLLMAKGIHEIMGEMIEKSILVSQSSNSFNLPNTKYIKSCHPIPCEQSIQSAKLIQKSLSSLKEDDFFIYLLSGGNSSLVELPEENISLEEFQEMTDLMLKNALPIEAINCVRKHISQVKGGKLRFSTKAKGIVLVLSDVLGNSFNDIGSAPFFFDNTTYENALKYLHKYNIWDKCPKTIQNILLEQKNETPKKESNTIKHFLLGSNNIVLKTAKNLLELQNIKSTVYFESISQDVEKTARIFKDFIKNNSNTPSAFIFGGEATVQVKKNGKGGRNQHLALLMTDFLKDYPHVTFLSSATDGRDGNSDACGAVIDSKTILKAIEFGIKTDLFLNNFDSNLHSTHKCNI